MAGQVEPLYNCYNGDVFPACVIHADTCIHVANMCSTLCVDAHCTINGVTCVMRGGANTCAPLKLFTL